MHALHRILVHIPDLDVEGLSKRELREAIRSKAECDTEDYYGQAFDWRETDSAGRWSDEFKKQVYIAADNIDWFIDQLERTLAIQKGEIDNSLAQIVAPCGIDLKQIVNGLWSIDEMYDKKSPGFNSYTAYYLSKIGKLLHGEYTFDSQFFNTSAYTARLYKSDIDQVKADPKNWALVMFDYHY